MPIICGADLETTGFKQEKGHRIVEFCAQLWDSDTRTLLRNFNLRVNPLRDIPADASRVHGIFLEDLHDAPTWEKAAPLVRGILSKAELLVCHNIGFDAPFMGLELVRAGLTPPDIQTFCTMENGRWATGNGKVPKLGELCWALEVDYRPEDAHAAEYDVQKMMECLWKGVDAGYYNLPI